MDWSTQSRRRLAALSAVLAVLPCAVASAQSWIELDTLTFSPVGAAEMAAVSTPVQIPSQSARNGERQDQLAPEFIVSRIRAVVEEVETAEEAYGENSPRLVPLLMTLAGIYLEIGESGSAIAVLEQAKQIVRRSEGLYSLDQAELIQQVIEIEMAITPNEQLSELESDLGDLVRRNPGDPRNVDILTSMAERQMEVARQLLINGLPPAFLLNMNLVGEFGGRRSAPPTARSMAASMLRRARSNYGIAMREALNNVPVNIPELLELEQTIVDTYYFELMNSSFRRRGQTYRGAGQLRFGGARVLNAKLDNSRLYPGTAEAYSSALIELADWHLMFSSFNRAMHLYDDALTYLQAQEGGEPLIERMLSPEAPVPLPASESNENVYSGLSDVRGYIDVEIKVNRFGGVRDVNMMGRSASATDAVARRLKRFVYQTRFRPRYADGEWQQSARFTLRYEFGYSSS